MAYKKLYGVLAIIVAILPAVAFGMDYIVGDSDGWRPGVDYTKWAEGKDFMVGDTLIFQYKVGSHNVFKVGGPAFQNCTVPPANEALTSGNDKITLAAPGKKWYICGVTGHCAAGQKLVINVMDSMAPAPAPNSAFGILPSAYQASFLAAAVAAFAILLMV